MRTNWLIRLSVLLGVIGAGAGCTAESDDAGAGAVESEQRSTELKLCAAIKGNGPRILSHFTALARITEELGMLDAAAGGSSGTISTFLYESMSMNPAVNTCGARPCSPSEKAERMAFLLKSVHGYGEIVAQETGLAALAERVGAIQLGERPSPADVERAVDGVRRAVNANVQAILNTNEILRMLREPDGTRRAANVREIQTAFSQFGRFAVPDNRVLFRVPIIDWSAATRVFGRAANFYAGAGYGPFDRAGTATLLDSCAAATRGKLWSDAKGVAPSVSTPLGGTCGEVFQSLLLKHRNAVTSSGGQGAGRARINDEVGKELRTIAHSMALKGPSADSYARALEGYLRGDSAGAEGDVTAFQPSFDDLVFGYWASPADTEKIRTLPTSTRFVDLKSKKLQPLGTRTWEYVLARSPAEPGIARLQPNLDPDVKYTAGGWGDGMPVQVLKQLGCQNVLLVTRQDKATANFARNLAAEFGASAQQVNTLYDPTRPDGVSSASIAAADGVWCTDWDKPNGNDAQGLSVEGYNAPLLSNAPIFQRYSGTRPTSSVRLPGCTPGVVPTP